jgi:hypothetical protein
MRHGRASTIDVDQFAELGASVHRALPRKIDSEAAQVWIDKHRVLTRVLRRTLVPDSSIRNVLADWQKFYSVVLAAGAELYGVLIPHVSSDEDWPIIVMAEKIKLRWAIRACQERFPVCHPGEELDTVIAHNDRSPAEGPYAIRFRNRHQTTGKKVAFPSSDLGPYSTLSLTLIEYLVRLLKCYDEIGDVIPSEYVTICTGSYNDSGLVPGVCWDGRQLTIRFYSHRDAYAHEGRQDVLITV